jgi:Uma2 family endonuclease
VNCYNLDVSSTSLFTAEQLLRLPSGMGQRFELVAGELRVMSPAGWRHGAIIGNLHTILGSYIRQKGLGKVFGAETGFQLKSDPDTVRAPDFAFISKRNIPKKLPKDSYWPGAPDLAVEVLSPSDRTGEVDEKITEWLTAGVEAVWIVDPTLQIVTIHQAGKSAQIRSVGDDLEGAPVVPGFSCEVKELFQ